MKISTLDINTKEWTDKKYGNTYFSSQITINYGMKTEKTVYLPMQYGYGSHAEDMAKKKLIELKLMRKPKSDFLGLHNLCSKRKIVLRTNYSDDLKRNVVAWGNE